MNGERGPPDLTFFAVGLQVFCFLVAALFAWKLNLFGGSKSTQINLIQPAARNFGVDGFRLVAVLSTIFEHRFDVPTLSSYNGCFSQHWVLNFLFLATAQGFVQSTREPRVVMGRFAFLWLVGVGCNLMAPILVPRPFQSDLNWFPTGFRTTVLRLLITAQHQFWYCLLVIFACWVYQPFIRIQGFGDPSRIKVYRRKALVLGLFFLCLEVLGFLKPLNVFGHLSETCAVVWGATFLATSGSAYKTWWLILLVYAGPLLWVHSRVFFFFSRPMGVLLIGLFGVQFPLFTPNWRRLRSQWLLIFVASLILVSRPGFLGKLDWFPPGHGFQLRQLPHLHLGLDQTQVSTNFLLRVQYYAGDLLFIGFGLVIMDVCWSTVHFSANLQRLSLFLYVTQMILIRVVVDPWRIPLALVPVLSLIGWDILKLYK